VGEDMRVVRCGRRRDAGGEEMREEKSCEEKEVCEGEELREEEGWWRRRVVWRGNFAEQESWERKRVGRGRKVGEGRKPEEVESRRKARTYRSEPEEDFLEIS
jgi:hypothetical protein